MVSTVIENIDTTRKNIDTVFNSLYEEVLTWADKFGVQEFVPKKTSLQRTMFLVNLQVALQKGNCYPFD